MIIHVPHASQIVPDKLRDQFVITDEELRSELIRMTDAYTDELFDLPGVRHVVFPVSRLVIDVERFLDNEYEPMSNVGMGAIYERTSNGRPLRRPLSSLERTELIEAYYEPHHHLLVEAIRSELKVSERALIVDCHSFPDVPPRCDLDQSQPRPDFCVGTDEYHTPSSLCDSAVAAINRCGFSVAVDCPYSGALVPKEVFRQDSRVLSIMLEVNRKLYLNEDEGAKLPSFHDLRSKITGVLAAIAAFQQIGDRL